MGPLPALILKDLDVNVRRVIAAQMLSELSNDHNRRHSRVATGGDELRKTILSRSQKG